ncbi:MAG: nicotinate-nucleotide adenylyltransferase [Planctomycetota bacterium]|jgi:nicotinate-nucleotide adenylyltransferase|nr:nicotinate-nucleotide adenylyltransferase [Planctomycetota bacterium]
MKIGIYGGSFDPIHMGHLILAEHVRDSLGLSKIIFVPARIPPHVEAKALSPDEHRLAMVSVAMYDNPRFVCSDVELKRQGPSYTIETIREFRRKYPHDDLHFIVGADSVREFPNWKDPDQIGGECRIVVGVRPGFEKSIFEELESSFSPEFIQSLKDNFVETPAVDISSTDIRQRIKEGKSIRHLVPVGVYDYIRTKNLYREC